jgi:hypothetical protein
MDALTIPGVQLPPLSLRLNVGVNLWGVDASTRRIALSVVQGRGADEPPDTGWFSLEIEQLGGGAARAAGLLAALPPFVQRLATAAPPVGVLVEQPYGQGKARPHPQSYYIVGVVLASIAAQFPTARVDVVEPSSWKCEALGAGQGFAKKPAILRWARSTIDYPADCPKCHGEGAGNCDHPCRAHDEADSLGDATCAAMRWSTTGRLR